jgi:thioredoxin 1
MGVLAVTDATFEAEVLKSELPVFIDLWAPWCGPCRSLTPIVEQLSEEVGDKVKFVKVNVDENPAISEAFGVQSIPLVAILKGNTLIDSVMGLRPHGQLNDWINAALEHIAKGLPGPTDGEAPAH